MDNNQNQIDPALSDGETDSAAAANANENPTSANTPDTSDSGAAALENSVVSAAVAQQAANPQPHDDGGATLQPQAVTGPPQLVASIEVYKDENGNFYTNLTHGGSTWPQHISDSADEVRGAVNEFLTEHLAA